jgi:hypothetical protein
LLEVNAYPGLEDVPDAEDAFVENVVRWWTQLEDTPSIAG